MKTKAIVTLLLLAICTVIYASEDINDPELYWRKTQEMNQMVERFKEDTGFEGQISYGYKRMRLGSFEGNFSDIPFTADADTTAFRQACERIVEKLLPYSPAKRRQLSMCRISKQWGSYTTDYKQQVGGYQVEGSGFLMITYDAGRKHFSIGDNTVELPDDVQVNITRDKAISIAIDYFKDQINPPEHKLVPYVIDDLRFHNPNKMNYSLKYIIYLGDFVYYVDASTGRLDWDNAPGDFLSTFVIKGKAYDPLNPSLQPSVLSDSLSMQQIKVQVDGVSKYTDDNGEVSFQASAIDSFQVNLRSSEFYITDYSDSTNVFYSDSREEYVPNSNIFTSLIGDVCKIGTTTKLCYGSNTYIHANDHISALRNWWGNFEVDDLKIVSNFIPEDSTNAGQTTYNPPVVRIKTGLHGSLVRHELSHQFTYQVLGNNHFNTTLSQGRAMTEALANYLSCSTVVSPYMIYPQPNGPSYDILNLSIPAVNPWSINEVGYSNYFSGIFLASAWWSLRSHSELQNPLSVNNVVDTLLVGALGIVKRELDDNATYRYKPRYFYNILMKRVDDDTTAYPLNPKQVAIQKAYTSRGFHFYPRVQSYSLAQKPRNCFSAGNQVHVNITEAPQNTPFRVFVIKHGDYAYTNGASVSTLNNHLASEFTPIEERTDADGRWRGLIWTIPTITENVIGDYDIIVDFGSPERPDGNIHFAFNAADVMDGFDGLNGPGFTVYDNGIDVVLAIDLSGSMASELANLQMLTKKFIGAMIPGDKINIFSFSEGVNAPNWNGGFINLPPTSTAELFPITALNQTTMMNSVGLPSAIGATDLYVPFFNGYGRFGSPTDRKKGMVLLSDGLHDPTDGNSHNMSHVSNSIYANYNPRDIKCYTMRFNDVSVGAENMRNIAFYGHGAAYQVSELSGMSLIVSRLLNRLRGTPPSFDNNYVIPANSDQTFQIVVDDLADALRATLIWRTAGNTSDRYCTLTSPSGIVFNQPDIIGGVTLKFNIPSPESGIWDAIITNNRSTTQGCSIIAEVDSDLRVAIEEIPAKHPVDHPLLLKVSVMNYVTPVSDALIYATLEKNDCQYSTNLYDDGNHNDGNADDGLYANYIYAYSEPYQHGDFDLSFVIDIPSINGQRVVKQNIYLERPQTNSYPFVTRNLHKGWNWVGYPRLKRDEFGVSKDEFGVSIEYANLSLAPYLHEILYFEDSAQYSNNHWNYYGLNSLKSPDGYKLRIDSTEDVKLYELGTIVDTLMMHPLYQGQWHWYTYPCYEKVYPQEALLNVINNIDYIMAEKWSMKKENGVWIFGGFGRPYLKYGDSIMIRATQNGALVWNNPYTTPLIVEPQKPIHFTFEDKPEYETLMIESIEGNQDFSEIGVFQDGECIGARVIQAYPIQILAYSTPPEEGGGNLSFLLYSDNKAVVTAIPSSDLYEINTDPPYSLAPEHFGFRGFSLKTDGQQLPVVLSIHSNYPNPFNPSTTISFSIPSSSNVKLTVYNIRGQVVRELSNAMMERGRHIIQWDGKDDRNSSVSSGLYFARLEHCGETKVRKMMLVK